VLAPAVENLNLLVIKYSIKLFYAKFYAIWVYAMILYISGKLGIPEPEPEIAGT
jgi:hypothetical protein